MKIRFLILLLVVYGCETKTKKSKFKKLDPTALTNNAFKNVEIESVNGEENLNPNYSYASLPFEMSNTISNSFLVKSIFVWYCLSM